MQSVLIIQCFICKVSLLDDLVPYAQAVVISVDPRRIYLADPADPPCVLPLHSTRTHRLPRRPNGLLYFSESGGVITLHTEGAPTIPAPGIKS